MNGISIISEGKVLSHVWTGAQAAGAAEYLKPYSQVFIVCDKAAARYASEIAEASDERIRGIYEIETSEDGKSMETVMSICRWMLEKGADRKALVLAVGGGITTDMAGFAACIYKRGVRFAFVPTTLLSQVDAAIGGKTGVNFMDLKNMLGVIRQPEFTYECPEVLETLPYRDFVSGTAEMVKTFIIDNTGEAYEKAISILSAIKASPDKAEAIKANRDGLLGLISAAAAVKAGVVSRDQFENGERRKLNLGHTFAHAIEWEARGKGYDITHGEAVAIGMIQAAELSEKDGIAQKGLASKLEQDFRKCGLPVESPFGLESMEMAMTKDKKAEGDSVHFVLIEKIGSVVTKDMKVGQAVSLLER